MPEKGHRGRTVALIDAGCDFSSFPFISQCQNATQNTEHQYDVHGDDYKRSRQKIEKDVRNLACKIEWVNNAFVKYLRCIASI